MECWLGGEDAVIYIIFSWWYHKDTPLAIQSELQMVGWKLILN